MCRVERRVFRVRRVLQGAIDGDFGEKRLQLIEAFCYSTTAQHLSLI